MNELSNVTQFFEPLMKFSMVIMAGLYFTFSNTIMKSLKSMSNGADVMVEINKVILNPVFMACFIFSGFASAYLTFTASDILAVSGLLFFVGSTLVTIVKNVPLNNKLLAAQDYKVRQQVWGEYLSKWVFWNHVRTASTLGSGFLLVL